MGIIFEHRISEAKGKLEEKIKMFTEYDLGLKRKRKLKKAQSQSKRGNLKDIFTENKKNNKKVK